MSDRPVILITGCNRGLGLEFVAQYAARGWRVIATARNLDDAAELLALAAKHPNVSVESLDVGDGASIDAAAARHAGTAIDVLLNNAGLLGDREKQAFDVLDYSTFEEVMR
ncbi:MAG: SDR family NAD(P)-dependent oxidoreductase, partial [Gammaproteobacteria bacterium]|nr:SDR family NAD(P)-dependent oxidoreductase [Gammaproteobacteria bacterium]